MNKQTRQEVDKEAKKIVQEELSREMGAIRTQLNEIKDSLQLQSSQTFNPYDLIQQTQQFFEESQRQLREMGQQLTDFIEKATPLLNQSVQPYNANIMSQPYNQHGNGPMQQTNNQMNPMSRPITQPNYGQNPLSAPNLLSQNTQQARINPTFNNGNGQGQMNPTNPLNPNAQTSAGSFNQTNSLGTQTPNYFGIGHMYNQQQTNQNFQNQRGSSWTQ